MHPYVQPWIMFLDFVCFYLSKLLLPSLQYLLVNAEINYSHTLKKNRKKNSSLPETVLLLGNWDLSQVIFTCWNNFLGILLPLPWVK